MPELRDEVARAIYEGAYAERGGRWECVEPRHQDQVWGRYADAAIALTVEACAKVLTGKADQMRGSVTGDMMARIFEHEAAAIRRLALPAPQAHGSADRG